jgi:hypothetical protein
METSVFHRNFEAHELTYGQWKSVLHLSTRWGFASLRKLALKSITPPTPHDRLVLARTYSVDQWVLPALTALCERILPLSLDEARQMSMEDVILVAAVREEIRDGALRVDAADILRHVEVAQAGKLDRLMGNDVYWDGPKSGTTGQESNSMMASGIDPNVKVGGAPMIYASPLPGQEEYQVAPRAQLSMTQKREGGKGLGSKLKWVRRTAPVTSNSVDNTVVQEPEPVATAPVEIFVGAGEGVIVDVKTESGEDYAPVTEEKPDATADDDEWSW